MASYFDKGTYRATVLKRAIKPNHFGNATLVLECKPHTRIMAGGQETPVDGDKRAWVDIPIFHLKKVGDKKYEEQVGTPHKDFEKTMEAIGVPKERYADCASCGADEIVIYNFPESWDGGEKDKWRISLPREGKSGGGSSMQSDAALQAKMRMAFGGNPSYPAAAIAAGFMPDTDDGAPASPDDNIPF